MFRIIIVLLFSFYISYANEIYHSVKGGVLSHSTGFLSYGKEDGTDLNIEVQFKEKLLKGHIAVGADLSTNNNTSFIYSGLVWEDRFFDNILLGFSFGLSIHNGELDEGSSDKRQLGTLILFREAFEIGYYLNKNSTISILYDHYSNGGITGDRNQGNDNLGIRYGYYF